MTRKIVLEFNSGDESFELMAKLFDTPVADSLYASLPQNISLTHWGQEMYGSVQGTHGSYQPVSVVPRGGLAYTKQGSYFCVFYGQTPAWPVEHVGQLLDSDLSVFDGGLLRTLSVRKADEKSK